MKWQPAAAKAAAFLVICSFLTILIPVGNTLWSEILLGQGSVETKWTPTPDKFGCTYTQGYWKNHPESWPVDTLILGMVTYNQGDLLAIFNTPPKGDASVILAHQIIAAKLNSLNGASGSAVASTISAADSWLGIYPVGSNPGGQAREDGITMAGMLDQYNNGVIGPGHCEDEESVDEKELMTPEPTLVVTLIPEPVVTVTAVLPPSPKPVTPEPVMTAVPIPQPTKPPAPIVPPTSSAEPPPSPTAVPTTPPTKEADLPPPVTAEPIATVDLTPIILPTPTDP